MTLRNDVAILCGALGIAGVAAYLYLLLTSPQYSNRIWWIGPLASLAVLVGEWRNRYETPARWIRLFAAADLALLALGAYLTYLVPRLEGLSALPALGFSFLAFLAASILSPLLLVRGVRGRRGVLHAPLVNYRSSRGPV